MADQNLSTDSAPELTEKGLKWGYWYVTHRQTLRRILIAALIIFNVIFLGYSLVSIVNYAFVGYFEDQRLAREIVKPLINWPQIHERAGAKSIEIIEASAFSNSRGKSNFITLARNPNSDFYAAFDYRFVGGFGATPLKRGFILPGEEKALLILGVSGLPGAEGAQLEFSNLAWRRISRHEVPDIASHVSEKTNFSVTNLNYTPGAYLGLGQDRLTFDLTNNTVHSFSQVKLNILLYSGGRLVGAEQTAVDAFNPGETRPLDLRIDSLGAGAPEVRIMPEVDIFDKRSFID